MKFQQQKNFDDAIVSQEFIKFLQGVIIKTIKEHCKFDRSVSGKVVAVSGNYASVTILDSETVIPNVKNKSGEILKVGDDVILEALNGSYNNLVIKYKKGFD